MFKRILSLNVIVCFFLTSLVPLPKAHADSVLGLPTPGTMVNLSPAYEPVIIKGLTIHKDNPFLFDFIVDVGQDKISGEPLKKEGEKLIKYFLASLAIPDKDVWVNLSPYEKNRMIPEALGQTDMGRDLLEQDYILKQITASLIYPEKQLGKTFWNEVYAKAQQMYGTTEIPVNTFNKVWIMADRAEVFEHNQTAFVVDSHLKVMLEEDYLALSRHSEGVQSTTEESKGDKSHSIASQVVRQIILPHLEKEVNTGKNFANLRQILNSLILANWYKKNLKQALLNQVYTNQSKVNGIDLNDPTLKQQIYEQYLKAYKKGVFNYIKEDVTTQGGTIPRKYFSGGFDQAQAVIDPKVTTTDFAALAGALPSSIDRLEDFSTGVNINHDSAMLGLVQKLVRQARIDNVRKQIGGQKEYLRRLKGDVLNRQSLGKSVGDEYHQALTSEQEKLDQLKGKLTRLNKQLRGDAAMTTIQFYKNTGESIEGSQDLYLTIMDRLKEILRKFPNFKIDSTTFNISSQDYLQAGGGKIFLEGTGIFNGMSFGWFSGAVVEKALSFEKEGNLYYVRLRDIKTGAIVASSSVSLVSYISSEERGRTDEKIRELKTLIGTRWSDLKNSSDMAMTMRLRPEMLDLENIVPLKYWDMPVRIVLIADNTGTLTEHFGTPLSPKISEGLKQLLSRPENTIIINTGDPLEGIQDGHQDVIKAAVSNDWTSRYFAAWNGGTSSGYLGDDGKFKIEDQVPDWPIEMRYQFVRALAVAFYDKLEANLDKVKEDIPRLTEDDLIRDRQNVLAAIDRKFNSTGWSKIPEGEKKNVAAYLLADIFGKEGFIYDSGAKVALDVVKMSKKVLFLNLAFFRELEKAVQAKIATQTTQGPVITFAGSNFLDISASSKADAVERIVKNRISITKDMVTVYLVIGDGGNDIPTMKVKFGTGQPNEFTIPVFLDHDQGFAADLPPSAFVSKEPKVGGAQDIIDWANNTYGKTVRQVRTLDLQSWRPDAAMVVVIKENELLMGDQRFPLQSASQWVNTMLERTTAMKLTPEEESKNPVDLFDDMTIGVPFDFIATTWIAFAQEENRLWGGQELLFVRSNIDTGVARVLIVPGHNTTGVTVTPQMVRQRWITFLEDFSKGINQAEPDAAMIVREKAGQFLQLVESHKIEWKEGVNHREGTIVVPEIISGTDFLKMDIRALSTKYGIIGVTQEKGGIQTVKLKFSNKVFLILTDNQPDAAMRGSLSFGEEMAMPSNGTVTFLIGGFGENLRVLSENNGNTARVFDGGGRLIGEAWKGLPVDAKDLEISVRSRVVYVKRISGAAVTYHDSAMRANPVANHVVQDYKTPGGIDLNTSNGMQWKVSKDGNGVEMDVDPAMLARIQREGINWLSPVIFKMTPVTSVWSLVGLQAPVPQERLVGV